MLSDLSDLATSKKFIDDLLFLTFSLHVLRNNTSVMGCSNPLTKVRFEMQFGVGCLGHFYLTSLLTEKLKANVLARVINVSSTNNSYGEESYDSFKIYAQSNLGSIVYAKELQHRFDADGVDIIVCSVHPGMTITDINSYSGFFSTIEMLCSMHHFVDLMGNISTR